MSILVFLTVVFMHLVRKNSSVIALYAIQSVALTIPMFVFAAAQLSLSLLLLGVITFIVKVVIAPKFFFRLIKKHGLVFSVSTYLNAPVTVIIIAFLTISANAPFAKPYLEFAGMHQHALSLGMVAMFISLFLIVNRKGALSQIIGVLSLENSIAAAAFFAGLEQSSGFQLGILFEILVWIIIAVIFLSMMYKHFGSLDGTTMRHLQE